MSQHQVPDIYWWIIQSKCPVRGHFPLSSTLCTKNIQRVVNVFIHDQTHTSTSHHQSYVTSASFCADPLCIHWTASSLYSSLVSPTFTSAFAASIYLLWSSSGFFVHWFQIQLPSADLCIVHLKTISVWPLKQVLPVLFSHSWSRPSQSLQPRSSSCLISATFSSASCHSPEWLCSP